MSFFWAGRNATAFLEQDPSQGIKTGKKKQQYLQFSALNSVIVQGSYSLVVIIQYCFPIRSFHDVERCILNNRKMHQFNNIL